MSFTLVAEFRSADGKKFVIGKVQLVNSDTVAKDVTATVTIPQLCYIIDVVGYKREDTNNSGVTVKKAGETGTASNQIVVTAQSVPASSTTYVGITVLGY